MSLTTRSIYNANPATFDATQPGVSIGDLVVDPAGTNPPGLIKGPNSGRTVAPLGGAASGPDNLVVGVVTGAPLSGITTINLVVQTSAFVAIPNALVLLAWTTTIAGAPTATGTTIATVLGGGTLSGIIYVKADAFGIIAYTFNVGSGALLTVNISSVTTNPGQQLRSFTSP